MAKFYRIVGQDGPEFHELPKGADLPEGAVTVTRLPKPFEDFIGGKWVKDTAKEAKEEKRRQRHQKMSDPDLLMEIIEDLQARVTELERKVQ